MYASGAGQTCLSNFKSQCGSWAKKFAHPWFIVYPKMAIILYCHMIYILIFIFADSNLSSELSQLTIGSSNKTSSSEKGGSRGTGTWGGISGASSAWDTSLACSASSDTSAADSLSASILSGVATERKRNLGLYSHDTVMKLLLYPMSWIWSQALPKWKEMKCPWVVVVHLQTPFQKVITKFLSEHSFNVFLQQHIDQALGKGFDDNVGRHSGPVFFYVSIP